MGFYIDATTGSSSDSSITVTGLDSSATLSGTISYASFNSTTASSGVTWMGPIVTGTMSSATLGSGGTDSWSGYLTVATPEAPKPLPEEKLAGAMKNPVIQQFTRNVREAKIVLDLLEDDDPSMSGEDRRKLDLVRRSLEEALDLIDVRKKQWHEETVA